MPSPEGIGHQCSLQAVHPASVCCHHG